ncbi:MAG: hypothetical protein KGD72_00565 [Candidatus Lokiarchaeota archaeon]|nr:hypothetical protein [Candidatus Lokiarchaeota archaeon]
MERKVVIKWVKIFSISFLILSLVGLIDLILFSTLINLTLDSQQYTILTIIFQSDFMTFHAVLIWIVLLSIFCSFIALSCSIFKFVSKNTVEDKILAKFLLLIGLFLIIGGFITMSFIVLLGKSTINTGITNIIVQEALLSPSITPVIGAIMWLYFPFGVACFLISGLIFGGIGLKWMLLIEEEESNKN